MRPPLVWGGGVLTLRRTPKETWLQIRRGLALAASLFEHDRAVPDRCAACRLERGLPCDTDDQEWHDTLTGMIARIEVEQDFHPRCPECRLKRHKATERMEVLRHG